MDQYIDQEQTFSTFSKSNKFNPQLVSSTKAAYPELKHPTLIMLNLVEIIKHKKNMACISSPNQSGRTLSCLFVLLNKYIEAVTNNESVEKGIYFVVISASREKSTKTKQLVETMLSKCKAAITTLDLNEQFPLNYKGNKEFNLVLPPITQSTILFGTYYTFCKMQATNKFDPDLIKFCLFDDCNMASIYGGIAQLIDLSRWIQQQQLSLFVGDEKQIEKIVGKAITVAKIEEEDDEENAVQEQQEQQQKQQKQQQLIEHESSDEENLFNNYYYYLFTSDQVQKCIAIYISLKLNIAKGKTLILVNNLYEVYYVQLLLKRCNYSKFQIYNHENPKSLKYYILSTFNTGVVNLLVATPQVLEDLTNEFQERKTGKSKSKQAYTLKRLDNIILYNILPNQIQFKQFKSLTTVINILDHTEINVEETMQWMQTQDDFNRCEDYPITNDEIEAFRYRIEDSTKNISKHQVKLAEQLDFKKKLIKSPDLVEYFTNNQKEKELVQDQIIKIKKQLNRSTITLPDGPIPDYLLPNFIKKQKRPEPEGGKARVLVQVRDKRNEKLIQKRRLLNPELSKNMLPEPEKETEEDRHQTQDQRYMVIDQDQEDPLLMDPSRLRSFSGRKQWKLRHGYKLKKRNKRLEKKGIFTS